VSGKLQTHMTEEGWSIWSWAAGQSFAPFRKIDVLINYSMDFRQQKFFENETGCVP